ncbi:hypothetical protein MLD38_032864 [Melastoma candidum]|uniref:Uncharacterized protein n=1 Tax=Melastoma candidum TaxID=119954 RepID=A0ACB9M5A5_9MYRT|nr:hypothetical protein MLD38_032864 [Melastoma candidum]
MESRQGSSAAAAATTVMLTSGASERVTALFSVKAIRSYVAHLCAFLLVVLWPFRFRKRSTVLSVIAGGEKGREERSLEGYRKGVRVPASALPLRVAVSAVLDQEVAVRRALAKKRVVQDEDEVTRREYTLFTTSRGDTLFTQTWTPVGSTIRGLVVLLHGLNEHCGRYSNFAKKLNENGFKVFGMDWIGHGGSDGLHAYVHSLDDVVSDLESYLEKVKAQNPGLPCFCFGHSTGGAIILKTMLDPKVEAGISGVVLTSPAVGVQPVHPIYTIMAPILAFLLPRYQIGAANNPGMPVSRDPEALLAKYSDPLVYTDSVTDPGGSLKLFKEASSTEKTIKLLEGHVHDFLFEPEPDREAITREIIEWLTRRVER